MVAALQKARQPPRPSFWGTKCPEFTLSGTHTRSRPRGSPGMSRWGAQLLAVMCHEPNLRPPPLLFFHRQKELVGHGRSVLRRHHALLGSGAAAMPTGRLAAALAARLHEGTTRAGRRAFAADLILAGPAAAHTGRASRAVGGGGGDGNCSSGVVMYHVTPLGHVRAARGLAVGAGAAAATERLVERLARSGGSSSGSSGSSSGSSSSSRVLAAVAEGAGGATLGGGSGGFELEAALGSALEALLAACLESKGAREALGGGSRGCGPAAPASGVVGGASTAGEGSSGSSEAGATEDGREELQEALREMLVAAESGAIHVACCSTSPDWNLEEIGTRPGNVPSPLAGAHPMSKGTKSLFISVPPSVTINVLRKLSRQRQWWA